MTKNTLHRALDLTISIPLLAFGGSYIGADVYGIMRADTGRGLIVKEGMGVAFGILPFLYGLWLVFKPLFRSNQGPVKPTAPLPNQVRWRTFWVTASLIGTINALGFIYYLSRPIVEERGLPSRLTREMPDVIRGSLLVLNLPGVITTCPFQFFADESPSPSAQAVVIAFTMVFSTLLWSLVMVAIEIAFLGTRSKKQIKVSAVPPGTASS